MEKALFRAYQGGNLTFILRDLRHSAAPGSTQISGSACLGALCHRNGRLSTDCENGLNGLGPRD